MAKPKTRKKERRQSYHRAGWRERWFVLVPSTLRARLQTKAAETALQEGGGGVSGTRRFSGLDNVEVNTYDTLYIFADQKERTELAASPLRVIFNVHVVDVEAVAKSRRSFDVISDSGERMHLRCHSSAQSAAWQIAFAFSITRAALSHMR
jgi:hypothetical protein|tara:strand:- start:21 stop:473 length:453 start_codon:yes stop_codon:yes gene_type:complete